jgi:endonuclease-8
MPEGDTLFRTADVLRRALLGSQVRAARGRPGGARLERLVGSHVTAVTTHGKHLLLGFDVGLTLHTHLGMKGAWHRYSPGDPWRRQRGAAAAVIETDRVVAECFAAPVVELLETRALELHPIVSRSGPDLLDAGLDVEAAAARFRLPSRNGLTIAEALLDQGAVAGLGNVYRSEILFCERVDPFAQAGSLASGVIERLLGTGARLLGANLSGQPRVTVPDARGLGVHDAPPRGARTWVYGRAGRPCRRCGTLVLSRSFGQPPRRLYWCPDCQPSGVTAVGSATLS